VSNSNSHSIGHTYSDAYRHANGAATSTAIVAPSCKRQNTIRYLRDEKLAVLWN